MDDRRVCRPRDKDFDAIVDVVVLQLVQRQ